MLVDPASDAEAILVQHEEGLLQKEALYEAINVLTGRERQVFEVRRLAPKPLTLDQLAHEFSISAERVRQIEARAFAKIKRAALNRIGAARCGNQLAKSCLPQPRAARDTHGLEHWSVVVIGDLVRETDAANVSSNFSGSADMRFVWVNDRVPRKSSICTHCGVSLGTGCLRDIASQPPYCGYECYLGSNDHVTVSALPNKSDLVGVPAFGFSGYRASSALEEQCG